MKIWYCQRLLWAAESNRICLDDIQPITAPKGDIYISGCYVSPWKTAIFNPEIDQYGIEAVEIDYLMGILYHRNQRNITTDTIKFLNWTMH